MIRSSLIVFMILHSLMAFGQEITDSIYSVPSDTLRQVKGKRVINIDTYAARFNPRKALLFSAILPGSGQFYNKKYWKMPLVYGGFAASVYLVTVYQDLYFTYKNELYVLLNDGSLKSPSGFNEATLRKVINKSKRERDFFSIVTGFWYILQLVDAHVDSHLKEFDVNPQLQVRLEPVVESNPLNGQSVGLALKFKF